MLRGASQELYDRVRAEAGWLERTPAGGLAHLTWWDGEDCHNIDAWESEEAYQAFAKDLLGPAMAKVGATAVPEVTIHEAYEVFTPAELRLT